MAAFKAILFDLDDTLWPIVPVIERAEHILHAWLQEHVPAVAREVTIEGMRERRQALMATDPVYQLDLRRLREAVLREAFLHHGADTGLVTLAMEVFSRARNEVNLYPDVPVVLPQLRQAFRIGSISNGVADLKAIGIDALFEVSLAAHQVGVAKPDPEIFLAACRSLQLAPQEIVYVGDDPVLDIQGARAVGMAAVWLKRPQHPPRRLPATLEPDAVCADLHQLQQWLDMQSMQA
ncbi:MAG TPA: HAD family hydrolase [Noviherbaspirillum sp.]